MTTLRELVKGMTDEYLDAEICFLVSSYGQRIEELVASGGFLAYRLSAKDKLAITVRLQDHKITKVKK